MVITRWDEWFSESNLSKDKRILAAPPSKCAESAALEFIARGKRFILDLACGIGRDTFHLESRGLAVVGADAAINGLWVAQQAKPVQGSTPEWVAADARCLPFKDGSFDGVYCFGLLHEFTGEYGQENVRKVMSEIRRMLRVEGILVLTALSGDPQAGLPAVQLFTRQMFDEATQGLRAIEIKMYEDVGCTGMTNYCIWYGLFEKRGGGDGKKA